MFFDKVSVKDLMKNAAALNLNKSAMINEVIRVSVENDLVVQFKSVNYDSVIIRDEGYIEIWIRRKNSYPSDCYHFLLTNKNAEYLKTGLRKVRIKELENVGYEVS